MNSVIYRDSYDRLSAYVADRLNVQAAFSVFEPENLVNCDIFLYIDQMIQRWLMERLLAEDIGAKLGTLTIPQICEKRNKMHFGKQFENRYRMLASAYKMVSAAHYVCPDEFGAIVEQYCREDCKLDQEYRNFYYVLDRIEDSDKFEPLRNLIENIYANEYLAKQIPKWNNALKQQQLIDAMPLQRRFYKRYLRGTKERTVVIISDAMRYEVGCELFARIQDDPKCMKESKLECMLSTLPSYTRLGMAALLPNDAITLSDDYEVMVDGKPAKDLSQRQAVLQAADRDACCIQFDDLATLKGNEFKSFFTGKHLIYVYHNQIDARGDKQTTEHEVFAACEEAVAEIVAMIQKIAGGGNTYRFVVTADHGFLYRRERLAESDKINGISDKKAFKNRRFVIADEPVVDEGVSNISLGMILENQDTRQVSFPISSNVFKMAGGGQNYVHGGSSPQEMLVPVIEIKMDRGRIETTTAQIALVSMVHKITNLITTLEFIQSDAISDTVKTATYKIYFLSEENERISNENTYIADKRDDNSQNRMFRMRFTFKNKKYDKQKQYYLVVFDEASGLECWRHSVIMDLAFSDDFGF
jgi:uncharacterized protein (TIGR02687 family)